MSLLEQFNEYHILFLMLLDNPCEYFNYKNIFIINESTGEQKILATFFYVIEKAFPDLKNNEELCSLIWNDLFTKKLINIIDFTCSMSPIDLMRKQTTDLGSEFLHFICDQTI
jgi:hypothetical protein